MAGCCRKSPRGCPDASTGTPPRSPHRPISPPRSAGPPPLMANTRSATAASTMKTGRTGTLTTSSTNSTASSRPREPAKRSSSSAVSPPVTDLNPKELDMTNVKKMQIVAMAALVAAAVLAPLGAQAQQNGVTRTDLQRQDISAPGREAIQVRVDLAPGVAFGKHTHHGEEVIYVLEGTLEYQIEDKPPVTLKAGDVLFIPAGTVHSARNPGSVTGSELATYI